MNKAVISGVGADKPGIVAALSGVLLKHGYNIEDSTMTRLADEFATILIVSGPANVSVEVLRQDLATIEAETGMTFVIKPLPEPTTQASAPSPNPYLIAVAGNDRTGITHRVATVLAAHRVNITDLNAHVISGEDGPVYIMMVEIDLPPSVPLSTLEADLRRLAGELAVEIQIRPLEAVAL